MATTLKRVDKLISSSGYVVNINEVGTYYPPIADGHSMSASEALLLGGYKSLNNFPAQRSKRSFADFSVSTDWGSMAIGRGQGGVGSNGTYYIWGGGFLYNGWRQNPTKNVYWGSFTTNSTEVRLPDLNNSDSDGGNWWNNCVSNDSECIVGGGQTHTVSYYCCNSSDQYNFYSKEKTVGTGGGQSDRGYIQYGQASNGTIGKFTGGYYGTASGTGGSTANSRGYHFSDRSISQSFPNLTQAKKLQSSGSNATIELILGGWISSNNTTDVERYSFDEKTYNLTAGELSASHSHSFGCSDGNVVYATRSYSNPSGGYSWASNGIAKAFDSNVSMVTAAGITSSYYHGHCSGN